MHRTGSDTPRKRQPAPGHLVCISALLLILALLPGCSRTPLDPPPTQAGPAYAGGQATATMPAPAVESSPSTLPPPTPPVPAPTASPPATALESVEGLPEAAAASLRSLQQVDDFPLYTMHLYGAYPAASSGLPQQFRRAPWACSLFAALGEGQEMLYGRNFDWDYSPALLLLAHPPDGYASVSMVDLAYLFEPNQVRTLASLPLAQRTPLLEAIYWPFDGLNEQGLAIGMAAVPGSEMPRDPDHEAIGSLGIIREMLDHARNVDEALEIMGSYNISMEGGPSLHYLIADRSGQAVLVEFAQGRMHVLPNETAWHTATNHLRSQVAVPGDGGCWRYRTLGEQLAGTQGKLTSGEAMDLLESVSQPGTQWSVVYGISSGEVQVSLGREYETVHAFQMASPAP